MELTLDQALEKGIGAHKAGRAQEADRYYTAILKANPKHPDANHNMGVLAVGIGKVQEALPFFKKALEANTGIAQYWLSYIDALVKLDRITEAKAVLNQAKSKGAKGDGFEQLDKKLTGAGEKPLADDETALKETPKLPNVLDSLKLDQAIKLATTNSKEGSSEEAKRIYQDILAKFPKNKKAIEGLKGLSDSSSGKASKDQDLPQKELNSLMKLYNQKRVQQVFNEAQKLTKRYTKSRTLWNLLGISATQLGQLNEAVTAFQKAINIKPDYPEAYYNMGNAIKEQGKLEEAIDAYNKALSIKPDYADAYYNMGNTFKDQGKLEEAMVAYNKAISIKPDLFQAYNNMGNTLQDHGKLEEAIEAYTKALSIKPDLAEAWTNGADALEKWNRLGKLERWLDDGVNSFKKAPADLLFMKCKLLWRYKKYEQTSNLLENIKFESISEIRKRDYLHFKAKYFEKCKKFDDAYACFTQKNLLAKESKEYLKHNPEQYFKDLRDNLDKLKLSSKIISKVNSLENSQLLPNFLVGFPRSGTTLLDTVLRSNSKINVVEEQGMLSAASNFLKTNSIDDFPLQSIPNKLLSEAREIYKREFKQHINTSLAGSVFIDKLPLNLLKAPLIHQLYPNAKFILALRHPMDTILSCWMQNFKLNNAMANMVDLDRIVDFYCIAMETFKICRTKYNLNIHEIRYEDLINNFQKETEAVVQFLNLQWEPEMENYQDTALKRGRIYTPSYSQVVQPIYKDAQYRWLNYRKYLEQYLEKVKPWISEFGYRHR